MKVNYKGIALIKHFESLHDGDLKVIGCQPKMDPVGIWTVGYGRALWNPVKKDWYRGEKDKAAVYKMYASLTEPEASEMLRQDLKVYEQTVLNLVKRRDLTEDQFSALVSFCYNCGTHYTNALKIKVPFAIWKKADEWDGKDVTGMRTYWEGSVIKAGGKVLPGLVRRRKAEAHLFLTGQLKFN